MVYYRRMKKLSPINFSDIITYPAGLIVIRELSAAGGAERKVVLSYDTVSDAVTPVPEQVYLSNKFGESADNIAAFLDDPAFCESAVLKDGRVFVIFNTGECAMFGEGGTLITSGALLYKDTPVSSCCYDGKYIWTCAPEQNVILAYKTAPLRLVMRIGTVGGNNLRVPVTVRHYKGFLYVCCEGSNRIIKVNPNDLTADVYKTFRGPVYNYLQVDDAEFAVLRSGLYRL